MAAIVVSVFLSLAACSTITSSARPFLHRLIFAPANVLATRQIAFAVAHAVLNQGIEEARLLGRDMGRHFGNINHRQ